MPGSLGACSGKGYTRCTKLILGEAMMRLWAVGTMLVGAATLAGCGEMSNEQQAALVENAVANAQAIAENVTAEAEKAEKAAEAPSRDSWIGKWVGVEGLALDIEPGAEAGKYALTVTLMDGTSKYVGTADGETIRFTRGGKVETIKAVTGADTGLKYLATKDDCLMIKSGEGFCRD